MSTFVDKKEKAKDGTLDIGCLSSHLLYRVSAPAVVVPSVEPDRVFDAAANSALAAVFGHVIEVEGLIREVLLAKRMGCEQSDPPAWRIHAR